MPRVRPGSPTLDRLVKSGRWDEQNQCARLPLRLLQLPEEIIGLVAAHMNYQVLIKWLMTCKTFNRYCWNTWRGQALLLRTPSFGTNWNFCHVFKQHVGRHFDSYRDCNEDLVEVGLNVIYNYCLLRTSTRDVATVRAGELVDRMNRVRNVMENAREWYKQQGFTDYGHWTDRGWYPPAHPSKKEIEYCGYDHAYTGKYSIDFMCLLSAMHAPIQVEWLLPKTGLKFKQAIGRTMRGYCVPWTGSYAKWYAGTHFIDGDYHEADEKPQGDGAVEPVAANNAPEVQQQIANLFGADSDEEA